MSEGANFSFKTVWRSTEQPDQGCQSRGETGLHDSLAGGGGAHGNRLTVSPWPEYQLGQR